MAKEKPGVMLYWETLDVLENLPDGQAKIMLHAIRHYSQFGEAPDFGKDTVLSTLWILIRPKIDADTERYENMVLQRKYASFKRDNKDYEGSFDEWVKQYISNTESNQPISADTESNQPHPTTNSYTTSNPNPISTDNGYKENIRDGHSPSSPHYHFPTAEGMAALEEEIKRKKESNVI